MATRANHHKVRKQIDSALAQGFTVPVQYKLRIKEDMIDLVVEKSAFGDLRQIRRFELLSEVLEKYASKLMTQYTFIYTTNCGTENAPFSGRKWYTTKPTTVYTPPPGTTKVEVTMAGGGGHGGSKPGGAGAEGRYKIVSYYDGPLPKTDVRLPGQPARVFTEAELEQIKQFRIARSLKDCAMFIRDTKDGRKRFTCEDETHGNVYHAFSAYHNPHYQSKPFESESHPTGLKTYRQMDMEKYDTLNKIHRLPLEEKPHEKFKLGRGANEVELWELGDTKWDPYTGRFLTLTDAGWLQDVSPDVQAKWVKTELRHKFREHPGLQLEAQRREMAALGKATDASVGKMLKEKLDGEEE